MESFNDLVMKSMDKILKSGDIEKTIEAALKKTMGDIIDSEIRSYSNFGKNLEEIVKQAFNINPKDVTLPQYNDFLLKIITHQVEQFKSNELVAAIKKNMENLLTPAPKEIKLSKIIEDFKEHYDPRKCGEYFQNRPEKCTVFIETSEYGSRVIHLDPEHKDEKYQCAISFMVSDNDNRIFALRYEKCDLKRTLFVDRHSQFECDLYQMSVGNTKVEVDIKEEDVDCHYSELD